MAVLTSARPGTGRPGLTVPGLLIPAAPPASAEGTLTATDAPLAILTARTAP